MKRLTVTFFFLISLFSFGFSQQIQEHIIKSDLIIEGRVLEKTSYWNETKSMIFTDNKIKVFKNFSDSSVSEEIIITTKGGVVGNDFQFFLHFVEYGVGQEGLFFLVEQNHKFKPAQVKRPFLQYQINGHKFKSNFIENKVYEHPKHLYDEITNFTNKKYTVLSQNTLEQSVEKWLLSTLEIKTTTDVLIEFTFENVQVTDIDEVEFDIMAKSTLEGIKFAASDVYISYSTDAFGENVVANDKIEATKETIIENEVYELQLTDASPEIAKFLVSAGLEPDELYPLSLIAEKFLHVKLEISDILELANISFEDFLMGNQSFFYDENTGAFVSFDKISVDSPIFPFLAPQITSIPPSPITAGTGDILTITGNNFDEIDPTNSDKYKVKFANGDEAGFGEAYAQHQDIVSWTDTEIQVRVPSATNQQGWKAPACSGGVWVERPSLTNPTQIEQSNEEDVHIRYAVLNFRTGVQPNSLSRRFAYSNQTSEGIKYTYHPNVPGEARSIFRNAVRKWCFETSVAWTINDTETLEATGINGNDGINIVKMMPASSFPVENARAAVAIAGHYTNCTNPQELVYYIRDIDVYIRDDFNPFSSFYQEYKWYNRLLHELGHAHGLNHSKNPSISSSEEYIVNADANNLSNTFHDVQNDDKEGANSCFAASAALLSLPECVDDNVIPLTTHDCDNLNSTAETSFFTSEINLYPNPTNEFLNVEFTADENELINVSVSNILGDKIISLPFRVKQGDNYLQIQLKNTIPTGTFFISFQGVSSLTTRKFTKL